MMETYLKNNITGFEVKAASTTEHPNSSYGQPVWVDEKGTAYCQVGMEEPFYTVETKKSEIIMKREIPLFIGIRI